MKEYKKYKVSEECIGCRACIGVAGDNFDINENNQQAYLKKQPESDKEEAQCQEALNACPVNAISVVGISNNKDNIKPILAASNIKEILDKYPELKNALANLSPKFKRIQNPLLYNTLARFANFNDAARMTGLSVCEILHTINKYLGIEEKLLRSMPDCIKEGEDEEFTDKNVPISWQEGTERYIYNNEIVEEIIKKVSELPPQHSIVNISVEKPNELLKVADGLGFIFNIEKNREYRVSIFNPQKEEEIPWTERKDKFEILDVKTMATDPFDIIIKKAYEVPEDSGFILIQRFEPHPIINMLLEIGFEHLTEQKKPNEFWIYLHKKVSKDLQKETSSKKVDVVIQSATPVAYPIIMRLLQSERIRKHINIKELKVWEETEKHLAWITNGKADISFSSLLTIPKLTRNDIKVPAIFVWDNFVLLTRYKANGLEDVKGKEIHIPLFNEAPPAKITRYLITAHGLNPDDFKFVFGKPFGRPEEIYKDFVTGKADTVILREPEASYAIKMMQDRDEEISIISFNKLWSEINPEFGSFPNAGIVLKGEFVRKYPKLTKIFLEELKAAIDGVNNNKKDIAQLSFDIMRQPVDRIELFLNRVKFDYVSGERLVDEVKQYFDILNRNEIVNFKIDKEFLDIFRVD